MPMIAAAMTGTATAANRGHHGSRDGRRSGSVGTVPGRRSLDHRLDGREHAVAQVGRRRHGRHRIGERRGHRLGLAQLPAAAIALGDVQRDLLLLVGRERVHGLAVDQLVDVFHSSSGCRPAAPSVSRNARMAAKVRLLTVPMGTARRSASSDWE